MQVAVFWVDRSALLDSGYRSLDVAMPQRLNPTDLSLPDLQGCCNLLRSLNANFLPNSMAICRR